MSKILGYCKYCKYRIRRIQGYKLLLRNNNNMHIAYLEYVIYYILNANSL